MAAQLYAIENTPKGPVAVGEQFVKNLVKPLVLTVTRGRLVKAAAPAASGTLTGLAVAGSTLWTVGFDQPSMSSFGASATV